VMSIKHPLLATLAIALQALCSLGGITREIRWDVAAEEHEVKPKDVDILRGDTVVLSPRLMHGGKPVALPPGAVGTFYWQTNGMHNAWWSTPAVAAPPEAEGRIVATWVPAMDSGALHYTWFVAVQQEGTRAYRASGTIRMRPSPGAVPNELPLPRQSIDFATVEIINPPWTGEIEAALADLSLSLPGGYASPDYWWITYSDIYADKTNTLERLGDIFILFASGSSIYDKRLEVEVNARMLDNALTPPDVTWSIVASSVPVVLDGDVVQAPLQEGAVTVEADAGERGIKRQAIVFAETRERTVLQNPAAEDDSTFRHELTFSLAQKLNSAPNDRISHYQYCRNADKDFLDAFQLYGTNGANDDAVLPTVANRTFFDKGIGDQLRCVTAWRGDHYAHAPYVVIAPHYAVGAAHFAKSYTRTWWCFDRDTDDFRYADWDPAAGKNGVIGTVRDVSIHRFAEAMPQSMIVHVMRNSEIKKLSPSVFSRTMVLGHTCHNTVAPYGIMPGENVLHQSVTHTDWHEGFRASWDNVRFGKWIMPDEVTALLPGTCHTPHLWDSGHPIFWVMPTEDTLVLAGTWTTAYGGSNAFASEALLDAIETIIRADSGGAEGLKFMEASLFLE